MSNYQDTEGYTTIQLNKKLHRIISSYCSLHGLEIRKFVEEILKKEAKKLDFADQIKRDIRTL